MISIIICSRSSNDFAVISKNIGETIGVNYEIIRIDNSSNCFSLCQAYNEGAKKATFPFVCFVHEDVKFLTKGWGSILIKHLSDPNIGLIGVAGSSYKSSVPSSWWTNDQYFDALNIVQHFKRSSKVPVRQCIRSTDSDEPKDVVVLDGVFLATRLSVLGSYKFDSKLLTGFHGYDIDFSLQILQEYKIKVVFDILLEHFSEGNVDLNWLKNAVLVSEKWRKRLPISTTSLSYKDQYKLYYYTFDQFAYLMSSFRYSKLRYAFTFISFIKLHFLDYKLFRVFFRYL